MPLSHANIDFPFKTQHSCISVVVIAMEGMINYIPEVETYTQFHPHNKNPGMITTNSPNSHLSQLTILVETTTLPSASDPNDNIEAKNS